MDYTRILIILLLAAIVSGCVESKPSAPTSVEPTTTAYTEDSQIIIITPEPTQDNRQVIINYSATKRNAIGMYDEAPRGKVYLIVSMNITNRGYDQVNTNPNYFYVIYDNVKYDIAVQTYSLSLDNKLDSVDLLDGGSTKGSIVFEVPSNIDNYQLQYDRTLKDYNIVYLTH